MPISGPTPAEFAEREGERRDEGMRNVMKMIMAAKQYQNQMAQQDWQKAHTSYQDALDAARTEAAIQQTQSLGDYRQSTEFQRNYEYGTGTIGMSSEEAIKAFRPRSANEAQDFDLDPVTIGQIEKSEGLPTGSFGRLPNQGQRWYADKYKAKVAPDKNPALWETTYGRQLPTVEEALKDYEADISQTKNQLREIERTNQDAIVQGMSGPAINKKTKQTIPNPVFESWQKGRRVLTNLQKGRDVLFGLRARLAKAGTTLSDDEFAAVSKIGSRKEDVKLNGLDSVLGNQPQEDQIPPNVLAEAKRQRPDATDEEIIRAWQMRKK